MKTLKLFLVVLFFVPLVLSGQVVSLNGWYEVSSKNCIPSSKIIDSGMVGRAQSFRIDVINQNDTASATWEKRIDETQTPFAFDWWWNLYDSKPFYSYVRYQFYIGNSTDLHQLGYPYQSDMSVGKTWWYGAVGVNDPISGAPTTIDRIRIRVYTLPNGAKTEKLEWRFDELVGYDINGKIMKLFDSFEDSTIVGVEDQQNIPTNFKLFQNYPNPFNPATSIKYTVSSIKYVNLTVYDVLGREIAILVNEEKSPGEYEVKFNASNLSSGTYFYVLRAGNFSETKKMLLVK